MIIKPYGSLGLRESTQAGQSAETHPLLGKVQRPLGHHKVCRFTQAGASLRVTEQWRPTLGQQEPATWRGAGVGLHCVEASPQCAQVS